jgi:uncharacterized protein DUF6293
MTLKNSLNNLLVSFSLKPSSNRIDIFDILRALRTIILKEKGNSILVNVSVGSKIQAISSMMGCMMFKDIATL